MVSAHTCSMEKAVILASGSRYRQQLLEKLQLRFESLAPDIDESPLAGESPIARAERLAIAKAEATALLMQQQGQDRPALIIGSDQVAALGEQHIGKPGSTEAAEAQLRQASGKTLYFHTGLCLLDSCDGSLQSCVETYTVRFRQLSEAQISAYVAAEQPLDCAGSFKSEGLGIALFESISGDDPNTLVGLPLIRLSEFLRAAGLEVLA